MKNLSLLFTFVLVLSCSKKEDTTATADTTQTAPVVTAAMKPITLTAEEMEQVNWAIFLSLHSDYVSDPEHVALNEEFTSEGNVVRYSLIRHNGNLMGYESDHIREREERQAQEEAEELARQVALAEQQAIDNPQDERGDAETGEDETDYSEGEGPQYAENNESEEGEYVQDNYTNDIDSLVGEARYMAYEIPEPNIKKVLIVFSGSIKHTNAVSVNYYGEIVPGPETFNFRDIYVELHLQQLINKDDLYLRAKIGMLTERELDKVKKDELQYLRNEIFARHGHTFKTDKMVKYFSAKEWYRQRVEDAAELLNQFERKNVELIKKREG